MTDRLRDLADAYLEDTLSPEGLAELETLLREDAEARAAFVRYARLDLELFMQSRAEAAGERALRLALDEHPLPPAAPPARTGAFAALEVTRTATFAALEAARQRKPWLMAVAAVSVTMVMVVGLFTLKQRDLAAPIEGAGVPRETVVWLSNAQNCHWPDDDGAGHGWAEGDEIRLLAGLAEVRFRSDVRMVIEGPAQLEVASAERVVLHRGRLSATVPANARGFTVLSPHGKVIDLGTEFGVSVGEDGATEVVVFDGEVVAGPRDATGRSVKAKQAVRLTDARAAAPEPTAAPAVRRFARSIVVPPVVTPRTLRMDFGSDKNAGVRDRDGRGVGLTQRLPGTGTALPERDANLRLNTALRRLELLTTDSDINKQVGLPTGEYLGVPLKALGFTGAEDFEVRATVSDIPKLDLVGQFGLYAGDRSDRNIRGGVIAVRPTDRDRYRINLVNNRAGVDEDSLFLGLLSPGDEAAMTLRRVAGKYSLTVENRSTASALTLSIRHPDHLDGLTDLHVGLFGANTRSDVRRTLHFCDVAVTVWTARPAR